MIQEFHPRRTAIVEFALPNLDGRLVRRRDFHGKRNLVVAFVHSLACSDCQRLLEGLKRAESAIRDWTATVLVVAREQPEQSVQQPFPTLVDLGGRATASCLGAEALPYPACVMVLDRWGEAAAAWCVQHGDELPTEQVVEALRLKDTECPECGVPTPEWLEQASSPM
jgi:peroxiredoxin